MADISEPLPVVVSYRSGPLASADASGSASATVTAIRVVPTAIELSAGSVAVVGGLWVVSSHATVTASSSAVAVATAVHAAVATADGDLQATADATHVRAAYVAITLASTVGVDVLPIYRLRLPETLRPVAATNLLARYEVPVQKTLIFKAGGAYLREVPTETELADADAFFRGGYFRQLSEAEYQMFVTAGVDEYVEIG